MDGRTGRPLAGAAVLFTRGADTLGRATTDTAGAFVAGMADTSLLIAHFRGVGYRPDSIATAAGREAPLRVAMAPVATRAATTLAPVRVAASENRTGFEQRARRRNGGYFIRRADIVAKGAARTSELFQSIPGVALSDSGGIIRVVSMRGYRRTQPMPATGTVGRTERAGASIGGEAVSGPESAGERCIIRIGVDGRLQDPSFSVNEVNPEEIEGIEAYMGAATIPIEFSTVQRNATCGLIMIWTRRGPDRDGGR